MLNWLDKLSASFAKKIADRKRPPPSLKALPEGLTVELDAEKIFLPWASIDRVTVFKRDLYTVDMICMLISAEGKIIELNEQMDGWGDLSAALESYLPGCIPWAVWTLQVLFPAFETNAADIYDKNISSTAASP